MGDRYRNRSYYDQNQNRGPARDEESRYREQRNQGVYRDWDKPREFGAHFGERDASGYPGPFGWTHDPEVERDFDESRGSHGRDHRDYDRDPRSRPEQRQLSSYVPRSSYGSERDARFHAGDWRRPALERGYGGYSQPERDWNRGSYGEDGYYVYAPREHEERGIGQQLRDAGQAIARKVKRAFRGPKGYKRSDERIREDVNDRLAQQDHFDPSEIEVMVTNGEVTLTGTVRTRGEKFLAEEIADDVSGVGEVHNQLRVQRHHTSPGVGATAETQQSIGGQGYEASRNRNSRAV